MNMITEQELHPSLKLKINSKASSEINIDKIIDSDGESIKEKLEKVTSQYEEFEKKNNKKIDDFIDTKNKANGIAGLDEEGKVKKELLPSIDNISIYGEKYEPILQLKPVEEFLLIGDAETENTVWEVLDNNSDYIYTLEDCKYSPKRICKYRKRDLKLIAKLEMRYYNSIVIDNEFLYALTNYKKTIIDKIELNTFTIIKTIELSKNDTATKITMDDKYIYTNYSMYKIKKHDLSIIAKNPIHLDDVFITDNYIIGGGSFNNKVVQKYDKNTLKLVASFEDYFYNGVLFNNKIYYSSGCNILYKLNINTFEREKIAEYNSGDLRILLIENNYLYYCANKSIWKLNLKSNESSMLGSEDKYGHLRCISDGFCYGYKKTGDDCKITSYYIGEIYKVLGYKKIG